MGGESRPATELAMAANISPQNASNHLRLLLDANFLKVETLGRNKFYRLGSQEIAATLESMAAAFGKAPVTHEIRGTVPPQLLFARTCYDHLAGELSVKMLDEMSKRLCRRALSGLPADGSRKRFFRETRDRHRYSSVEAQAICILLPGLESTPAAYGRFAWGRVAAMDAAKPIPNQREKQPCPAHHRTWTS